MAEAMSTDPLEDAYRCLVARSCPRQSAGDLALAVYSGVCSHHVSAGPAGLCGATSLDATHSSLCLLHRIVVSASTLSTELVDYSNEVLRVLFHELCLMGQLLYHFKSADPFESHQAAKCVSASVVYHLQTCAMPCPEWKQNFIDAFMKGSPGPELNACLWSLTDMLKKLLKGLHHELVGNVLSDLDCSLCILSSKFLSVSSYICNGRNHQWHITFCLLLDLLEILAASSITYETCICLESQRIIYTHFLLLLMAVRHVFEYFARKKVVLLLKRILLEKLGEDWPLGGVATHQILNSDRSVLSLTILSEVKSNWLQDVEVKSEAFFGGFIGEDNDDVENPDFVVLRAAGLVVLKSIEFQVQTFEGADSSLGARVDHTNKADDYLRILWGFLRCRSTQLATVTHPCCWISLLFGEQDDDMMEAAKALLAIYLYYRRTSGPDPLVTMDAACKYGCNAHCNFLFFLRCISFDHRVLLDFLISSETCFLEYFVRYLKCLRDDRQGFMAACELFHATECSLPKQQPVSNEDKPSVLMSDESPKTSEASSTGGKSPLMALNPTSHVHLVDYDSSDDSKSEDVEASDAEPRPSTSKTSGFDSSEMETSSYKLPTAVRRKRYPSLPFRSDLGQTSRTNTAPQLENETSAQVFQCLYKLEEMLTRMHAKKLLPYDPIALLTLLAQV